jgi:hypothetical protein
MEGRELIADKIAEICDIITYKTNATDSEKRMLVGELMVLAGMIGQDVLSLADEYYRGIKEERSSDYADEFKKFVDFNKVKKKNKYDN